MSLKNVSGIINANEDWLIHRILHYAKIHDYTKYTSTLAEAWRLSISGLSDSLTKGVDHYGCIPEMNPDDDFQNDPLTHFGVIEARRHRERGVSLSMFLGLMKYYRQSYVDLIQEKRDEGYNLESARLFIDRSFDRIEIAFCQEWSGKDQDAFIKELQINNRRMTNEKNAYLTIFESLSDPAVIVNEGHDIVNVNHAAMSLIDSASIPGAIYYKPEDNRFFQVENTDKNQNMTCSTVIGCPLKDVFPWIDSIIEKFSVNDTPESVIECSTSINFEKRYFEVQSASMLDVSEKYTSTILSLREITKRKIIQQALHDSENRFRKLFEASIEGIALHDLVYNQEQEPVDYQITDVNPAFTKHTGINRDAAMGKTGRELYKSEISPYFEQFKDVALTGQPTFFETYFEPMDKYFRVSVFSPKPKTFATVFEDISDSKRAEQKLRESEKRYKSLFHNNHAVMLLIDPENGCIMDANPAAANYYQYDHDTLLKMKISDINTMSPEALAVDIKLANEKKRNQFYFHHRLANGEIRDVEVFSGPIIVAGKQLLYSIIHDVTDRKKMEEALQKSNRELDDFAYIASHDLREPLRGISNYATFLMEDYSDTIDAEGKNKLETLKRLCKREEDLIQSLLTYSQVGRTDLIYTPVDLNGLIAEVKETIESSFPDQTVQIFVPSRLPTIQCDAIRISEVFFNLVSNAIKYNEKPEKQIEIGYLQSDTGKWNLSESQSEKITFPVYYVRDNGIGIHEKHRNKIFMIFKRLHSRDKYGGGTGAGLTIVKKIIERHGGMIWLDSEVGKGTTFYFTLPSRNS